MSNWMRMAYPPTRWIVFALALIGVFDFWLFSFWVLYGPESLRVAFAMMGLTCFAAVGLAGFRLTRIPLPTLSNDGYEQWLAATPWQNHQRLPFGPWHPILPDLIPLGVLGFLSFTPVWLMAFDTGAVLWCFALLPTVIFFLVWGICGALVVWRKCVGALPVLALWFSGVFHFLKAINSYEFSPALFFAYVSVSLVTGVVLVWRKLTSELNKFPDRYHGEVEPVSNAKHGTIGTYRVLSPGYRPAPGFGKVAQRYRSLPGAFLIATIGWSYWNLLFGDMNSFMLPMLIVIVIGLVAMGMFVFDRYPNLGFAARWSRRQFIVPAYDRVWLIFLSVVAAGGAILLAGKVGIVGPSVSGPTGIAVALFVALRSGKDQEEWSFTAPCRHKLAKLQKTVT